MEVVHKHGKLPVLMEIRISEFWNFGQSNTRAIMEIRAA
jgi:hypothetical protein